ncbi:hypothetical protein Vafri_12151, partial [Volvox africanus]
MGERWSSVRPAVRALLPLVFEQIERAIERRILLDGRTGRLGFDSLCNLFYPRCPLSSLDLLGHTILFLPLSLHELSAQLTFYRRCRRQRLDTAACVLLPAYSQRKAAALLLGMRRVLRFKSGTALFNGVDVAGVPVPLSGSAYAVDVWYESPAPHPDGSAVCFEPV